MFDHFEFSVISESNIRVSDPVWVWTKTRQISNKYYGGHLWGLIRKNEQETIACSFMNWLPHGESLAWLDPVPKVTASTVLTRLFNLAFKCHYVTTNNISIVLLYYVPSHIVLPLSVRPSHFGYIFGTHAIVMILHMWKRLG